MIIQGGGTIRRDESDRSLLYDKANLSNYKMVKEGDFIVHLRSFEGGLEKATNTGIISPAYHAFHGENTDSRFYYSYFRSKKFIEIDLKPHVYGIRDGRSIDIEGMKTIKIPSTSYEEQKAIGTFTEQLDNLITLHQSKCYGRLRHAFLNTTISWEQRKLSNIADIVGGGTPSTSNPDYWEGDIDWYTPAEIGEQIFAYGSVRKITKEGLIHSSAKILPAHKTVLFTSRAGIGNMAILKRPAATNQGFQSLVCHDDIDPYFIFSMGDSIKAKAERVAAGSTFAEISGKKLGELEFMFPDTDEQKAIGAYSKNLDYLITLHQKQWFILKKLQFSPGSNSPVAA